ncbi:hypothetical protein DY000_02013040 [Brassica cretica]|uniref:Transposase MuDR plant domain-containing protein n=1 Tax=Brassica cretica TaxID=69181 RepID=A0ABQ7CWK7_BRACR|nr:hypothetical protein DY000_02013040 [Brassica cretica]
MRSERSEVNERANPAQKPLAGELNHHAGQLAGELNHHVGQLAGELNRRVVVLAGEFSCHAIRLARRARPDPGIKYSFYSGSELVSRLTFDKISFSEFQRESGAEPASHEGVIISAVTQIRCCGNQRNPPPSAVKVLKEMLLRFTLAAKESDYFVVSKQLELEISLYKFQSSKDAFQWEFHVDLNRNSSFISIKEDLQFEDLMKIVSEDLMKIVSEDFKEEVIGLSYGMPLDIKSSVEGFPPISIANTRHLRSFIGKSRSFDGTCRLCVKVNADSPSCNNQDFDTFALHVSTVQREIQVDTDPASCNRQTSDTFASHVPLNATPVFRSTVQREKQCLFYEGVSTVPLNSLPDFSPVHIGLSPTMRGAGDIKVNRYFKTKGELMLRMKKWALEWKFEYKTVSSNKSRVLLSCVDDNCTWRMRATKLPLSDFFVVKNNYGEKKEGLKPKQIIEQRLLYEGVSTVPLNSLPDFSPVHIGLSPTMRGAGDIKDKCPELAKYLEDSDFRKWARCFAPEQNKVKADFVKDRRRVKREYDEFNVCAYAESIHPGGELSTSTYPANIDELSFPPPATKKRSGRPPTKRKRSVGEFGVPGSKSQSHKCSRCGIGGHNKITCKRPIG